MDLEFDNVWGKVSEPIRDDEKGKVPMKSNLILHRILAAVLMSLLAFQTSFLRSSASASDLPEAIQGEVLGLAREVFTVYTLPMQILARAENSIDLSARLVFGSSFADPDHAYSTGTYMHMNGQTFYFLSPANGLEIIRLEGTTSIRTEFRSIDLMGWEHTAGMAGYFTISHLSSRADNLDLMITLSELGGTAFLDVTGTYQVDDQEYQVSLSRQILGADSSLQENSQDKQETWIRGLIRSEDLIIQVDEKFVTQLDGRVNTTRRLTHSRWTRGLEEYHFQDAWVKTSLRDGNVTGFREDWAASGLLLRNGGSFGKLQFRESATQVELILDKSGKAYVLDAWDIQQP